MTSTQVYLLARQVSARFSMTRVSRLYAEFAVALSRLERDALEGWGTRSAGRLLVLAGRRVGGLAKLATLLARAGGGELLGVLAAYCQRRLSAHIGDRATATIDGTISLGRECALRWGVDAFAFPTPLHVPIKVHALVQDAHDPNAFVLWYVKHDVRLIIGPP